MLGWVPNRLETLKFIKTLWYRKNAIIHILSQIVFFMIELAKFSLVTEALTCSWEMKKTQLERISCWWVRMLPEYFHWQYRKIVSLSEVSLTEEVRKKKFKSALPIAATQPSKWLRYYTVCIQVQDYSWLPCVSFLFIFFFPRNVTANEQYQNMV